jgi:hypothetical protein
MNEQYGRFVFRYNAGKVRIYIISQPDYQGRSTRPEHIHRLPSGNGAPYHICIKHEFMPDSFEGAREFAQRWARRTISERAYSETTYAAFRDHCRDSRPRGLSFS